MSEVPTKGPAPVWQMQSYVDKSIKPNIVPLLPRGEEDWPSFQVALRSACLKTPALLSALRENPNAGLLSVVKCARLGLSLDPALEHFALVPFKGEISGLVMVRGWIHLAREAGDLEQLHFDVIYRQEHDRSKPLRDPLTGMVNHVPHDLERDEYPDSDIVAAYAWVKLKGLTRFVSIVLTRGEIEKRRACGAGKTPAWTKWYKRMCCVKAISALMRSGMVPLTKRMVEASMLDDDLPQATGPSRLTVTPAPAPAEAPRKTGDEVIFDALNKNPLPDDTEQAETWRAAVEAECMNRDLKVEDAIKSALGKPKALNDLTLSECTTVLASMTAPGDDEA